MILAAGRGERMRPLSDSVPKPMLRVHGKPLIERHVERLAEAGIARVVINLAWLGSLIREYLGDGSRYGVSIHYSEEWPQVLGTGGGIFRALPALSPGPFLVVNGDVFTDYPFAHLRIGDAHDAHLVLVPNPPQHPHGDFGLEESREEALEVTGRSEAGAVGPTGGGPRGLAVDEADARYTFGCIAVYRPEFFDGCADGEFPLKPLWVRSMRARRCGAELYSGIWEDVGTPQRLAALNAGAR
jgi:MurNAc alpha-1-phosphate uridylyltransferase